RRIALSRRSNLCDGQLVHVRYDGLTCKDQRRPPSRVPAQVQHPDIPAVHFRLQAWTPSQSSTSAGFSRRFRAAAIHSSSKRLTECRWSHSRSACRTISDRFNPIGLPIRSTCSSVLLSIVTCTFFIHDYVHVMYIVATSSAEELRRNSEFLILHSRFQYRRERPAAKFLEGEPAHLDRFCLCDRAAVHRPQEVVQKPLSSRG